MQASYNKQIMFSKEQAVQKIKHYCNYRQRSHSEVKQKLQSYNLKEEDTGEIIALLNAQGLINDESFAVNYAIGKFRIKQWGKQKIKNGLQQKSIKPESISKALNAINKNDYQKTFFDVADKKMKSLLLEKNLLVKKQRCMNYLLQKGFEYALIQEYLR